MLQSLKNLTSRQSEILNFIKNYIHEKGFPPSIREIGEYMGIKSTNGVNDHLKALEKKGYLTRTDMKSRSLRLTYSSSQPQTGIPLVGVATCGSPVNAYESIEDYINIDPRLFGYKGNVFALRVRGDSMIEAGILEDDIIFIQKDMEQKDGDIVVANIDGETTVKYFYKQNMVIKLVPANKNMAPIFVRDINNCQFKILGTVIGVFRKI